MSKRILKSLMCFLVFGLVLFGDCCVYARAATITVPETDTSFSEDGLQLYNELDSSVSQERENAFLRLAGETPTSLSGDGDLARRFWIFFFSSYDMIASLFPAAFILSQLIGWVGAKLSSTNKKLKKRFITLFNFVFPIMYTVYVIVIPELYLAYR